MIRMYFQLTDSIPPDLLARHTAGAYLPLTLIEKTSRVSDKIDDSQGPKNPPAS
jgi:hypothetical protein